MRTSSTLLAVTAVVVVGFASRTKLAPANEAPEPTVNPRASVPESTPAVLSQPQHPEVPSACPEGMQLVEGSYCPDVRHTCKRYLDGRGRYAQFRCAEYDTPRCFSPSRVALRFCMDRDEYTSVGQRVPDNFRSFTDAERLCGNLGKRVCRESEWNFACEGEEMRPYPYGLTRDSRACNADHAKLTGKNGKLIDLRAPSDAHPGCDSPFGVRNMAGNLEEFVAIDGTKPARPAMKGAYWQPSRNFCRAAQTAHDRHYNGTETGFRCCADAAPPG